MVTLRLFTNQRGSNQPVIGLKSELFEPAAIESQDDNCRRGYGKNNTHGDEAIAVVDWCKRVSHVGSFKCFLQVMKKAARKKVVK